MASAQEVVAAFIAAIERRDVDTAVTMVAEDISYENVPIQPITGREAVRATLNGFLAAANRVEWKILREMAVGNVVANERIDRFEVGAGWLELPVAGFFEVNDAGLITLWRDYFDMATYTNQLASLTS